MSHLSGLIPSRLPILQAPMAGVSTPALAAAVAKAGGLGALGLGAATPEAAAQAIRDTQERSHAPLHVNFFCHEKPRRDPAAEHDWIALSRPVFAGFSAEPPENLGVIYDSFRDHDGFLRVVLALRPAVVSFHFGLPRADQIAALRGAGLTLLASATNAAEARLIERAGLHGIIAQGWEAGGHRGVFDPDAPDTRLGTTELLPALRKATALPVIAAGGVMAGHDIARVLRQGAVAAQLGTAFIGCPESAANAAYRARLARGGATVMTAAISGRPARCLTNRFTDWADTLPAGAQPPAYPCAYDLGKALNQAALACDEGGFGAQWAGMGAARGRALPAAELMATLERELGAAL